MINSTDDIAEYIRDQEDPVMTLHHHILLWAFGDEDTAREGYDVLAALHPALIHGVYRADAQEFLHMPIAQKYIRFRDTVKRMGSILELEPHPGESILAYFDRLILTGVQLVQRTSAV
jgi:hypothetical protein